MRILLAHNYYQRPGGEDVVFLGEKTILERGGHQVIVYERHNAEISGYSMLQKITLPKNTVWARDSAQAIRQILQQDRPQLAHFTNTFPLISPAAYYVCRRAGIPVVQNVQNFRLLCPSPYLLRNGHICEECLGKTPPWPSVLHACYRDSRVQTAVLATMLSLHQFFRTWQRQVDVYVAASESSRQKFVQGGLPEEKIVVKPNFVYPDPGMRETGGGDYVLFVGRLSAEKGLRTLLKTWHHLPGVPLKIVGDGPLREEIVSTVRRDGLETIECLGRRSNRDVLALMKKARFLVFPSEWYEGFPMTLVESFACGLPVIASYLGAMAEVIEDDRTGLFFSPGDPHDLANKVEWLWSRPKEAERMGQEARARFEAKYTAEQNYRMLMEIYEMAMARAQRRISRSRVEFKLGL